MKIDRGTKVHYIPFKDCEETQMENGIVKRLTPDGEGAFVVYNCGGEWNRIDDYTAANTRFEDLELGWVDNARNSSFCKDV